MPWQKKGIHISVRFVGIAIGADLGKILRGSTLSPSLLSLFNGERV
jgi:hypothetical protein